VPTLTPYHDDPLQHSTETDPPTSKYQDGSSIDWLHEESTERHRIHLLRIRGLLGPFVDASRMWFVVVATGVGIGFAGAWLDVLVNW
jgi:chloride channel 3/4/5